MTYTLFLKLGGSLITDKREESSARLDVIARLAGEIRAALAEDAKLRLVVGHGSGSFGHFAAQQFGFAYAPQSNWRGFAHIGAAAARLNRLVVEALLAADVPALPIPPSVAGRADGGNLTRFDAEPVRDLLAQGCVPVVFGDVCLDESFGWTIVSTEKVLLRLQASLHPQRVILAGEVAGVFTKNPVVDTTARLIPEISGENLEEVRAGLAGADGYDVTGGMLDKVEMAYQMAQASPGMEVYVVSGLENGRVKKALLGEMAKGGTLIRIQA